MNKKATSIVCYITWIGWLIAYLAGDKEGAKVHLNQSLILVIAQFAVSLISTFSRSLHIPFLGLGLSVVNLGIFVLEIIGIVWACQDKDDELPVIGSIKILK